MEKKISINRKHLLKGIFKAFIILLFIFLLFSTISLGAMLIDSRMEEGRLSSEGDLLIVSSEWIVFEDNSFLNYFDDSYDGSDEPQRVKEVFIDLYEAGLVTRTRGNLIEIPCEQQRLVLKEGDLDPSPRTIYKIKGAGKTLYVTAPRDANP